jgi:hypothetical protein
MKKLWVHSIAESGLIHPVKHAVVFLLPELSIAKGTLLHYTIDYSKGSDTTYKEVSHEYLRDWGSPGTTSPATVLTGPF